VVRLSETEVDVGADAALEGSYPVLPSERVWTTWPMFAISVSLAIATWDFLIGGFVAYYLGALDGILVMTAGSLVGIFLIILVCLPVATKYGVDSIVSSRPQLGVRGSSLAMIAQFVSVVGWNCLLLIFLGHAAAEILIANGVFDESIRSELEVIFGLLGVAAVWVLLRGGPQHMRRVGPYVAIAIVALSVLILILLLVNVGPGKIFDAKPVASSGSRQWDMATGFEILIAVTLAWWPYVGGMMRLAPSSRSALWPSVTGLALAVVLVSTIGLWSGLAIPDSGGDPTTYLVELGGLTTGTIALVFIVLANIDTAMVGVYVSAIGLKQLPFVQKRVSWNMTVGLTLAPVAVVVLFFSGWAFEHIGTFLAFVGLVFAPVIGVQLVDYYLLRRQRLNVRALYQTEAGSPYYYWHGFNAVGIVSIGIGFATYLYLLDPVNFTSRAPYEYISASIPSGVVAAAAYFLLTKLVVMPMRLGDYESASPERSPAGAPATATTMMKSPEGG
jgi:NCS1 family nucleobase:cation symporter-1